MKAYTQKNAWVFHTREGQNTGDTGSGVIWCLIIFQIQLLFKNATEKEVKVGNNS